MIYINVVFLHIFAVSFSKAGRMMFVGYDDYTVRVWDTIVNSSNKITQLLGHENRVSAVVVPDEGDCLCTSSWDSTIRVSRIIYY